MQKVSKGQNHSENSEAQIADIISERQFNNLSAEIGWSPELKEHMFYGLYHSNWTDNLYKPFTRLGQDQQNPSKYQSQYLEWKNSQPLTKIEQNNSNLLDLIQNIKQQRLAKIVKPRYIEGSILNYSQRNSVLSRITDNYKKQALKIVNDPLKSANKNTQKRNQMKIIENINQELKRQNIALKNEDKLNKIDDLVVQKLPKKQKETKKQIVNISANPSINSCFVNLIHHPPTRLNNSQVKKQSTIKIDKLQNQSQTQPINFMKIQSSKKKVERYKLNITQVLKIPPRLFLIFYSDNYHQIVRLATPQQLKMLDKYRTDALQKQEALKKLKKKLAQSGPELINSLPALSREKLFRVLYEQDVDLQKWYNDH